MPLAAPLLVLAWSLVALAPPGDDQAEVVEIQQLLDRQVEDWNKEDLDAFLGAYWNSPKLVFQSNDTKAEGLDGVRERYRKRYRDGGKAMGRLAFEGLEIEPLGREAAFARGRFRLMMPDGKAPTGQFTLVLRKFPEGWRIVHDHTSTAAP